MAPVHGNLATLPAEDVEVRDGGRIVAEGLWTGSTLMPLAAAVVTVVCPLFVARV